MKRFDVTSGRLFQGTVLLLGIPSALLFLIAIVFILMRLIAGSIGGGIGSFSFGITSAQLLAGAAIMLGLFLLLSFLCGALIRHRKRRNAAIDR